MTRRLFVSAVLTAASAFAFADSAVQIEHRADDAYANRQFTQAAALYAQSFDKDPTNVWMLYKAARSRAAANDVAGAWRDLEQAGAHGFTDGDAAAAEDRFTPLHDDARWAPLIAQMKQKKALDARLFNSPALATPYRDNISDDEKIAGLSKLWSEVKYNFVYADTLKQIDWDQLYLDYLPKVRATRSTMDYYRVLMELTARLKDGHTNVYPGMEQWNIFLARPLIATRLVEGHVLVEQVLDPALRSAGVTPGVEIVAVDGEPVKSYAAREIRPYQSASTEHDLDTRTYGFAFLTGPVELAPRVTFRDAHGKTFDARVKRVDWTAWSKLGEPPPFALRMLPGNIAYVALNSFASDEAANQFIAHFPEIARSSALILDVRRNGGGNSDVGFRILATLAAQPFQTGKWATRDYRPAYRAWDRPLSYYEEVQDAYLPDRQHRYGKPVVVLTSSGTYSAAEDFALAFDMMHRGLLIGEPTGGSTGQPLMFALPGGGAARVCTKRDTYNDGKVFVGIGIQPNLAVHPMLSDVQNGRDTVLNAALAALQKQMH